MESIKPPNFGVIVRTAAEGCKVAALQDDIRQQLEKWESIAVQLKTNKPPAKVLSEVNKTTGMLRDLLDKSFNKVVVNDKELFVEIKSYVREIAPDKEKIVSYHSGNVPIFDHYKISKQIKQAFGKTVSLASGAYLVVERTEAMHVIDVNSGNKMSVTGNQEKHALTVNLEAANEIARQLRLRDIGGIIVVDFIDMKDPANKKMLSRRFSELMESDRARHNVLPLSQFNILQITRERTRPEVQITVTSETCPTCNGTGKVKSTMLLIDELENHLSYLLNELDNTQLRLVVHPFVEAYMKRGIISRQWDWFWKYKKWVTVSSDANFGMLQYRFFDGQNEEIKM